MPELPEVETVRRGLEPALNGQTLHSIKVYRRDLRKPIPADFEAALESRVVKSLQRRGKYIIALTDGPQSFVLHLGMSGRIKIQTITDAPPVYAKHDHVVLTTATRHRVIYEDARRFGMLYLVGTKSWQKTKPFQAMGPEPLDAAFSPAALHMQLQKTRTAIKTALLDQRIIAGIGNIYANESLFESGIHPLKPANALTRKETGRLHQALQAVLTRAIKAGGSSLRDYRQADGDMGYFQHHFTVYNKAGQACGTCECRIEKTGGVQKIVQTGRSTFYCPRKQV